jgi:hypothetical protein
MARVLANVSEEAAEKLIEHGLGIKYIYTSKETGKVLLEVQMTSQKLKEIKDKVEKGELQAFSMIEITKMELAKLKIPSEIEEGVWLTDAYVKGSKVYYVASVENEVDPSSLSGADILEMKESLIQGLREEGLVMMHIKEMIKENVHFIYIYKDNRGVEFSRVDISPEEL